MARARIYKPAKTAMQSGRAKTRKWVLEFEPDHARQIDPLMGWTSSRDTQTQLLLRFDTQEEAVAYANKHGIEFQISEPKTQKRSIKAYADNFKYGRQGLWTH
ncbi:MAG: ETC complex I subunit [Rhizobiales bacterium]|nr:ETC complex I subunit [Hyphomicrobiales bacterium]